MQPIHCAHKGPPERMNATVLFMTQYPFREGEIEQRGEKCRTPVTISAPVSEVTLLSRTFSLSLSRRVYSAMSLSPFTLLLCLLTSGVKHRAGFHIPRWLTASRCLCL